MSRINYLRNLKRDIFFYYMKNSILEPYILLCICQAKCSNSVSLSQSTLLKIKSFSSNRVVCWVHKNLSFTLCSVSESERVCVCVCVCVWMEEDLFMHRPLNRVRNDSRRAPAALQSATSLHQQHDCSVLHKAVHLQCRCRAPSDYTDLDLLPNKQNHLPALLRNHSAHFTQHSPIHGLWSL